MKRWFLVLFILFCTGCNQEEIKADQALITFPGLTWESTEKDVTERYPQAERSVSADGSILYVVSQAKLWEETVSLSLTFEDSKLCIIRAVFQDIKGKELRERVCEVYGNISGARWLSEESVMDRLNEETLAVLRQWMMDQAALTRTQRQYRDSLLKRLYKTPLVALSGDFSKGMLLWNAQMYQKVNSLSPARSSGQVEQQLLMKPVENEEGERSYAEDGQLLEIRLRLTRQELEQIQKEWGAPCDRALFYGMPEGSQFWVSEDRVCDVLADDGQREQYMTLLAQEMPQDYTKTELYVRMYQTPRIKVYYSEESSELIWDFTGEVLIQRLS